MGFIWMIVVGLVAGLIARAIMPGADPMGWIATIVLGIVGSFVGGFLGGMVFGHSATEGFEPSGILGSIIGALIVLFIYRKMKARPA
jgi:uncharacterized membrane protein YeaQ/YmgE (transglycosylase-associated protein family)